MTIKEYWAILRKKKSVLAELDREIKDKQAEHYRVSKNFELDEAYHKKDLELKKREAMLVIKEQNFEVISRLEHDIKWLEDTLSIERDHSKMFISILNNTFNQMRDKAKEIQKS